MEWAGGKDRQLSQPGMGRAESPEAGGQGWGGSQDEGRGQAGWWEKGDRAWVPGCWDKTAMEQDW